MNPKLNKSIIVLHISAVIYLLLGIGLFTILSDLVVHPVFMGFVVIGIGVFVEIVVGGLKNNKFWAWVTALIICGMYVFSLFIILGIIGLVGLLDKDVRTDFLKK